VIDGDEATERRHRTVIERGRGARITSLDKAGLVRRRVLVGDR